MVNKKRIFIGKEISYQDVDMDDNIIVHEEIELLKAELKYYHFFDSINMVGENKLKCLIGDREIFIEVTEKCYNILSEKQRKIHLITRIEVFVYLSGFYNGLLYDSSDKEYIVT